VDRVPMAGTWTPPLLVDQTRASSASLPGRTLANYVSPSYFETLGIPLLRGRTFTRRENELGGPVAVISDSTARRLWPGEDALGKRAKLDMNFRGKWQEFEVVGVAKDVRTANLSRVDPTFFYLPTGSRRFNNILIRIEGDSKNAVAAIRAALGALDKDFAQTIGLLNLEERVVSKQRLLARTYAMFATMLAGLALILAAIGIYGVMSYLVSQRIQEIGIRMTLGATPSDVLKAVVRQGLQPVFTGAVLGLVGAGAVSGMLRAILVFPGSPDMLFGISMFDPLTFAGLTGFLAAVAMVACAIPARRATRVDPMAALRYQ
jgi:ABC-type antimicrobial peptide transport system permease subunit